jgi:KDO2-lipid IV(A) lauroyltransferase
MPFWMLYGISDILRFILFNIFGYRKKVIYTNLKKAFPEKSKTEIREIANKFYKSFTDILLEGFKGLTINKKSMLKRYKLLNPEILDKYYQNGQSVLCLGGHYCNWEWGTSIAMHMNHEAVTVYKSVKNLRLNNYMKDRRGRWGMKQISMEKTRTIFNNIEKPKFIILIADQNQPIVEKAIWTTFMGIETPCIHGPEVYSHLYNFPVIFIDFQSEKRGYFTAELSLITENPKSFPKGGLTKKYMEKLESVIRKKPEDWLWTHKRWKHQKVGDQLLVDAGYK